MSARLLKPMWRVIVRVEMGGGWYGLYEYRRRASLGMPSKRGVWPRRFRGAAHHGTARKTPQDQLNTPVHWARWTVRQQLTLRRHQARPKPRLGFLCIVSERGHAKGTRSQCPWYWIRSTPTSKSQEFGGLQPRDKRSRHPSHGMPRVDGEPDRGRPVFSGPANWSQKSGTFFSIQADCTSKPLPDSAATARRLPAGARPFREWLIPRVPYSGLVPYLEQTATGPCYPPP